jgi:hypothetical protein
MAFFTGSNINANFVFDNNTSAQYIVQIMDDIVKKYISAVNDANVNDANVNDRENARLVLQCFFFQLADYIYTISGSNDLINPDNDNDNDSYKEYILPRIKPIADVLNSDNYNKLKTDLGILSKSSKIKDGNNIFLFTDITQVNNGNKNTCTNIKTKSKVKHVLDLINNIILNPLQSNNVVANINPPPPPPPPQSTFESIAKDINDIIDDKHNTNTSSPSVAITPSNHALETISTEIVKLQNTINTNNTNLTTLINDNLSTKITDLQKIIEKQNLITDKRTDDTLSNKNTEIKNQTALQNINNNKSGLTKTKTTSVTGSNGGSKKSILKASKKNLRKGGKTSRKNNKKNRTLKKQKNKSILSK